MVRALHLPVLWPASMPARGLSTVATTGDGTTSVTSGSSSVCTVSGLAVSYVGVGTCKLTAHVASGTNYNAADGSERIWQPYALAVARYFNERATGELRYEHNIVPNPLSGATFGDGTEGTTQGGGKTCVYGAQTSNVFSVIVAVAPDVATAKAGEAAAEAEILKAAGKGYNPTYDLWSTAASTTSADAVKWVKNW